MNKKTKKNILLIALSILSTTFLACSNINKEKNENSKKELINKEDKSSSNLQGFINENNIRIDYMTFNPDKKGENIYVAYTKNEDSSKNLMIYNLKENSVVKSVEISKSKKDIYYSNNNGIYRIATGEENKAEIFDMDLNIKKEIRDRFITPIGMFQNGAISNDFGKIAFVESDESYQYLYISNLDYSEKELVLKLKYSIDKPYDLAVINKIYFNESGEKLFFLGETFPEVGYGISSLQAYGVIDIKTKEVKAYTGEKIEIKPVSNSLLVMDTNYGYEEKTTGKVSIVDIDGNKTDYLMKENRESLNAFLSLNGKYLVTFYEHNESENKEGKVTIRVYDTISKEIIKEIDHTFEGNKVYNIINNDRVFISEEMRKILIDYWNEEKQIIFEFDF